MFARKFFKINENDGNTKSECNDIKGFWDFYRSLQGCFVDKIKVHLRPEKNKIMSIMEK